MNKMLILSLANENNKETFISVATSPPNSSRAQPQTNKHVITTKMGTYIFDTAPLFIPSSHYPKASGQVLDQPSTMQMPMTNCRQPENRLPENGRPRFQQEKGQPRIQPENRQPEDHQDNSRTNHPEACACAVCDERRALHQKIKQILEKRKSRHERRKGPAPSIGSTPSAAAGSGANCKSVGPSRDERALRREGAVSEPTSCPRCGTGYWSAGALRNHIAVCCAKWSST